MHWNNFVQYIKTQFIFVFCVSEIRMLNFILIIVFSPMANNILCNSFSHFSRKRIIVSSAYTGKYSSLLLLKKLMMSAENLPRHLSALINYDIGAKMTHFWMVILRVRNDFSCQKWSQPPWSLTKKCFYPD